MTDEKKPYDLRSIDPIAPAPEGDEADEPRDRADRVGFAAAAAAGSTPAVGVAAERMDEQPVVEGDEERAAAETAVEDRPQSR